MKNDVIMNHSVMSKDGDQFDLEDRLHRRLSEEIEAEIEQGTLADIPPKDDLSVRLDRIIDSEDIIQAEDQKATLERSVLDRILGLGPLEPLLEDASITEVMVNDPSNIFVERNGQLELTDIYFRDEAQLRHVINRIVAPIGRRIDESSPLVDARLPDGSRVNAIIPPLALGGPALTIRKFSREPFTLDRLIDLGTINHEIAEFLEKCVKEKVSLIISGGTGSGKTTTLNALGLCIPSEERIITIEDAAELQLRRLHIVSLEARPPNIEGKGEITIRTLVRNALRMRPDRIIVGEVRGGEAFDMLQAMNTGHRGSLTTLHANSPADALIRLESMVLMAGFDMPVSTIRRMVNGAIEIIVQQDRLSDGRRVVTAVAAMEINKGEHLRLTPRFYYDQKLESHRIYKNTQ